MSDHHYHDDNNSDVFSTATTAYHHQALDAPPPGVGCTENGAPCILDTGSKCLEFFFHCVPGVSRADYEMMLSEAWSEDPATALKLVFQSGNCRKKQGGKSDYTSFLRGLLWIWRSGNEPCILNNVQEIAEQVCIRALLDLLSGIIHEDDPKKSFEGQLEAAKNHKLHRAQIRELSCKADRRRARAERQCKIKLEYAASLGVNILDIYKPAASSLLYCDLGKRGLNKGEWLTEDSKRGFLRFIRDRDRSLAEACQVAKCVRALEVSYRIDESRSSDFSMMSQFREEVAGIFATNIRAEDDLRKSGIACSIGGLWCKWAPRPHGRHNKDTGIAKDIADKLGMDLQEYHHTISAICLAAKIPESFVGRRSFGMVDYNRMPSLCRQVWGERVWKKNDANRYNAFLVEAAENVRLGKNRKMRGAASVKTGALLPHTVCRAARESEDPNNIEHDLQWHGIVEDFKAARGKKDDASSSWGIPVCDVSGSMDGLPMEVAVSLSMLLAESAPPGSPFYGKMITFHENPSIVEIQGIPGEGEIVAGSLKRRVEAVMEMDAGMSTDFEAVFDLILNICRERSLPDEVVVGTSIYVFSDMQFDCATGGFRGDWETIHESITRRFAEHGYSRAPTIIYWNLTSLHERGMPISSSEQGVVALSGFSQELLGTFMGGNMENITPESIMRCMLDTPWYAGIWVPAGP